MKKTVTKVIIPVAGLGTRFLPATKAQPKEMLAIVDKPVIQYLVEEAVSSGIKEIIFITGRNKRPIEDHFDYSYELENALLVKGREKAFKEIRSISDMARFTYVRQKEAKGDGDALLAAAHLIGDEPCAVLFGDDIVDSKTPCLKQIIDVYDKYQDTVVAMEKTSKKDISSYGVPRVSKIGGRVYEIKDVVEKPKIEEAPSMFGVVGKYIITPEVFEILKNAKVSAKEELKLAYALKELSKTKSVIGYEIEGKRYDCGSKLGFMKAVVDFGLKHEEIGGDFKKFLKGKKI